MFDSPGAICPRIGPNWWLISAKQGTNLPPEALTQGVEDVGDDVVGVLEPAAHAHRPGGDSGRTQLVGREPSVRGGCRVSHQRLRATHRRGRPAQSHGIDETSAGLGASDQLEREHSPELAILPLPERVLRMRLEARVPNPRHGCVRFENSTDGHCGLLLLTQTRTEGVQTAQSVHGVERRRARTLQHRKTPQRIDEITFAGHHAESRVVVTRHGLGGRVDHQLHAVVQRSHTEWRGQRGIDRRDRALDRTEFVEVDQIEQRIGRGLGEHEHGAARNHRLRERAWFGAVDECDVDSETRTHSGEQLSRSAVRLLLCHDVITFAAQAEHDTGESTHARGERSRRLGTFEFGHRVFERVDGGIAVTAVELGRS